MEACRVSESTVLSTALQAAIQWLWPKQVWPLALCQYKSCHYKTLSLGCMILSPAQAPLQWIEAIHKHWLQTDAFLPVCLNWVNSSALSAYPKWQYGSGENGYEPMIPIALEWNDHQSDDHLENMLENNSDPP